MSFFNKTTNGAPKEQPAGLFGNKPSIVSSTPAAPPVQDRGVIEAEKTRLAVEDAPKCSACGESLTAENSSKLPTGVVKHIGCAKAVATGVVAPDAPKVSWVKAAKPMEKEQIAKIEDTEVKARAEEHAEVATAFAQQEQPAIEEKGGRCPNGGQKVLMDQQQVLTRLVKCVHCDRKFKAKDKDIAIEGNSIFFNVPKHNREFPELVKPAVVTPPQAAVSLPPPAVAPTVADRVEAIADNRGESEMAAAASNLANDLRNEIVLFVDIVIERGQQPLSLDDYYLPIVRELESQAALTDLRQASNQHDLAYGRWKGALAASIRAVPPPPGTYAIHGVEGSEIKQVVVEAVAPMCTMVLRGAR